MTDRTPGRDLRALLVVACLLLCTFPAFAGAPSKLRFDRLSLDDGLPHLVVLSMLQDQRGFLWIATQGGVVRLDGFGEGHQATVYRHDRTDPGSLSDSWVWKMIEDRRARLWLATSHGLNRFDPETESFRSFLHDPKEETSLPSQRVWTVYEDPDESIWVGTDGGLARFDPETETFTRWRVDPEAEAAAGNQSVRALLATTADEAGTARAGALWVGTRRWGLIFFDPETGTRRYHRHDPADPTSLPDDNVQTLYRDRAGALWVGTDGGLARFDNVTGRFRSHRTASDATSALPEHATEAILEDRQGRLWVGTKDGLYLREREGKGFRVFRHDAGDPSSLPLDHVRALVEDRAGVLWVGTWFGGVGRVDPGRWRFTNLVDHVDPPAALDSGISAFYEDARGDLWVGSTPRPARLAARSGTVTPVGKVDERPANFVAGFAEDAAGDLWMARRLGELRKWNPGSDRFEAVAETAALELGYVKTVCRDRAGNVWIAHRGLTRLEAGPHWTSFLHDPDVPGSLASNNVRSLAPGRDGGLWLGYTEHGVGRLGAGEEDFEHYLVVPDDTGQPSVTSMVDTDDGLWLATNAGLFQMVFGNGEATTVRSWTTKDGLASDSVAGLLADGDGRLWLSTPRGLSRFDPGSGDFRHFGEADGTLPEGYFTRGAYRGGDGRMYFGGPRGMTHFHPAEILADPAAPELTLTGLRLFNEPALLADRDPASPLRRPLHLTDRLVLEPRHDMVSFEFAALPFSGPPAERYAYRLRGLSQDWIQTDPDRRFATFTHLPPGDFVFEVKARSHDGVWSQEQSFEVRVEPPLWRTPWAYLLYALLAGGLTLGLVLANRRLEAVVVERTAEVRQQAREIQAESAAKARFIANVSHEFRTPLTLTIGPLEELRNHGSLDREARGHVNLALRNARQMTGLVGQVLDVGRLEEGQMPLAPREADLANVVRDNVHCFRIEARRRGLTLEATGLDEPVVFAFDTSALHKVIGNLLSNAVKFTGEGSVLVRLEAEDAKVSLEVADSGRGIAEADLPRVFERYFQGHDADPRQPGTGIGLALVKELTELHGGRVSVRSQLGQGTTFRVELPRGAAPAIDLAAEPPAEDDVTAEVSEAPEVETSNRGDGLAAADRTTVLVVDDNPELRDFLAARLAGRYRVLLAADGEEALATAKVELPDVVISDVTMPRLDGLGLLRELRRSPDLSSVPVILLTARATHQDTVTGLRHGADGYLTKPFDLSELEARIAGLLASRQRLRDHLLRELKKPRSTRSFEERVQRTILDNLADSGFSVSDLATALAIDRTVLFRRVRQHFEKSPNELIRDMRLMRAAELLRAEAGNVTEVCYAVGFQSLGYFSQRFRERFSVPPSRYLQN